MAAPADTTGAIKSLDAEGLHRDLDNNTVYQFAANCDFSKLTVGEKVKITADTKDGKEMRRRSSRPTRTAAGHLWCPRSCLACLSACIARPSAPSRRFTCRPVAPVRRWPLSHP